MEAAIIRRTKFTRKVLQRVIHTPVDIVAQNEINLKIYIETGTLIG